MGQKKSVLEAAKNRRESLIKFLTGKEMAVSGIYKATGVNTSMVYKDLARLREMGEVHICRYEGGLAIYAVGDKPDVEPPEGARASRKKGRKVEMPLPSVTAVIPFRHWMDVALFGEYRRGI